MTSPSVRARVGLCLIAVGSLSEIHAQARPTESPETTDQSTPATASTDAVSPPSFRKLPPSHVAGQIDWYPAAAVRLHQEGRVLMEFRISAKGTVVSPRILASDAASVLQQRAMKLMQATTFEAADPGLDSDNQAPYRATIRFCFRPCAPLEAYPGSELIQISATAMR
jgi:TonB family protein